MQYLAAIRVILKNNIKLKRTIHVTFVPDEEIFGPDGMKAFVGSEGFKALNVGFLLDEGIASENEVFKVFYGERTCWRKFATFKSLQKFNEIFLEIQFRIFGQPGHGSLLLSDTAGESMKKLLDKIYDFRKSQEKILEDNPELSLGDVTSINVTK